jgi:hypothetical protein
MDRSAIPTSQTPVYYYELDSEDRIVSASDSWDTFALDNDGEHLVFEKIKGDSIWNYITDTDTQDLYRRIFAAARKGRPVQYFLRCDSPTVRRLLSVHVAPMDEHLRISTALFRADQREFQELRGSGVNDAPMNIPACSWCEKVLIREGEWQEVEAASAWLDKQKTPAKCRLSYTVCPSCREQMERQLVLAGN